MSGIGDWLETLGLGDFAGPFEAEQLTLEHLPDLTEDDLEKLGLPMGPRKTVLKAIEGLAVAPAGPAPPRTEAERRQLTVMFCDLVGSTALSERLDPEDLRILMAAYRKQVGDVITQYEGHVAQYLGDGVLAYFGWPRAHEDDGERAVRAALDVVGAVKTVEAPQPLQLRIGIATGPVVVGEGAEDAAEANELAVGETPNLAARLQGLAGSDEIVIGNNTRDLIRGAFDYDDLGDRNLKGLAAPVKVWRVKGQSQAEGRFEAQSVGGLTPFVGREAEIQLLLDRWYQARDGEGQVVLLEGEPGIGKSRIIQVLRERIADELHIRLRYQCSPYYTNSPFYPVIDQLERAAGIARDDSIDAKLDKLEAVLAQGTDDVPSAAPLIASMLSLAVDRYPPLKLSPQRQKDDTIAALAAQVVGLARSQPVLFLFEDAHWCDPTTIETLTVAIAEIETAPVLMVITHRPEFDPPWTGHGHVVAQSLSRLGQRQGADMVGRITGGKALPDAVLDQIVAKTDGVPLFVEELTKTVLEAGFLKDAGDHFDLDGPLPSLAIPATLQDSLMARLDRLSPVKEVAQIGACIGREFSYELLSAVSPLRDNELDDAIQQLINSELVFRRGSAPDAVFSFKHALVQDAAYESLLISRRTQLHGNLAKVLEENFADQIAVEPELAARHFELAGNFGPAADYWLTAGHHAMAASAVTEALAHLERALAANDQCVESEERDRREIEIRIALGNAITIAYGWGAQRLWEVLEPAHGLCLQYGNLDSLLPVIYFMWMPSMQGFRWEEEYQLEDELAALGERHDRSDIRVTANTCRMSSRHMRGQYEEARDFAELGISEYRIEDHAGLIDILANDMFSYLGCWLGQIYWILGWPDKARDISRRQLKNARTIGHPFNLCWALTGGTWSFYYSGEADVMQEWGDEAMAIAQEQSLAFIEHCMYPWFIGFAGLLRREYAKAEEMIRRGTDAWQQGGGLIFVPMADVALAEAHLGQGDPEGADRLIRDALDLIEKFDHRTHEAEAYRVLALAELARDNPNEAKAEKAFDRALAIARERNAKGFELRTALAHARHWQSQGKRREAHDLLAPVYDWFTEGFDTADLKDAKALLEELS